MGWGFGSNGPPTELHGFAIYDAKIRTTFPVNRSRTRETETANVISTAKIPPLQQIERVICTLSI